MKNRYYDNLNPEMKKYFKILCNDFPEWLFDYINTKELQRINSISVSCGVDYSACFKTRYFHSNLDHSVGVALIIWNFTHDKKQTLAGLFHDIATPVFKHSIDFMNGDYKNQESTEERTEDIIKNSKEITTLLKRDNISLDEVCDYKIYPIADNKSPRLAADRLEFNFSCGLSFCKIWQLDEIKNVYNNIKIVKNEENIDELAFSSLEICKNYIKKVIKLWKIWVCNEDKTIMNFLADITRSMIIKKYITIDDLYILTEQEILNKIKNSSDNYLKKAFCEFLKQEKVYTSNKKINDKYCIKINPKKRYINPLVIKDANPKRIMDLSVEVKELINDFILNDDVEWTYFDFDFVPYK